jgi:NADP-dependent 3-hydroxy acid dehydrogenase YdfG
MDKNALITGATSGIGKATAELLANEGYNLILCGRRVERLKELEKELSRKSKIKTLSFDVRDRKAVAAEIAGLEDEWSKIDILLNNAGNAHGLGPVHEGNIDDWDAMIDINVKGLLYVSKAIVPGMVERKSGHIINIGSIAGKEVYPNGNVYCASKYAVDAINQGMRIDLNQYGIKVTAINPGLVETEFSLVRFKGDKERANANYQGYKPLSAKDIAEVILFTLQRPSHVNISDLIILPTAQASATIVNKDIT